MKLARRSGGWKGRVCGMERIHSNVAGASITSHGVADDEGGLADLLRDEVQQLLPPHLEAVHLVHRG